MVAWIDRSIELTGIQFLWGSSVAFPFTCTPIESWRLTFGRQLAFKHKRSHCKTLCFGKSRPRNIKGYEWTYLCAVTCALEIHRSRIESSVWTHTYIQTLSEPPWPDYPSLLGSSAASTCHRPTKAKPGASISSNAQQLDISLEETENEAQLASKNDQKRILSQHYIYKII